MLLLAGACGPEDTLLPIRSIDIERQVPPDSVTSDADVLWLSGPGQVISFHPRLNSARRLAVPEGIDAEVLGRAGNSLLMLSDRTLMAASSDSAGLFAVTGGVDAAVLFPAGGFLLESIANGEIVARTLNDLRPSWGWGGVGAPTTALALSPEGDRLYQATAAAPEGRPTLRVRDLLSGRTLREITLEGPLRKLRATAQGELVGVGWDDDGSDAFMTRFVWNSGDLVVAWHRGVEPASDGRRIKLALSEDGNRIALTGNEETGLTLFDGETGSTIAIYSGAVQDAAFDDFGYLYLLTDNAVVRVE